MSTTAEGERVLAEVVSADVIKKVNFVTGALRGELRNCEVKVSSGGKCFTIALDSQGNVQIVQGPVCRGK